MIKYILYLLFLDLFQFLLFIIIKIENLKKIFL